jgi:RimJ/RimL family protein N-acetyltransferase
MERRIVADSGESGFLREGLLRNWDLIGGEWKDLYVYSKVREFTR